MAQPALPSFRYHPDPLRSGVFEPTQAPCPVCGAQRGIEYVGPRYSLRRADHLCANCISDGSAAKAFEMDFTDPSGPEPGPGLERLDELLHRTPGYFSAQGDPWPVHCNDFCALVGLVTWPDIEPLRGEVENDLARIGQRLELPREELIAELSRYATPLWAHLFRCLSCGAHRLVADYE